MMNFARVQMNDGRDLVLEMRHVTKRDGAATLLDDVSLDVHRGEILALLGPAGAGKTTVLRIAAGLDRVTSGEVFLNDHIVENSATGACLPPVARNVGLVFSSYAVWQHMSAAANVAYPLTVRKRKGPEVRERVAALLEVVGLGGTEQRSASQLDRRQQLLLAIARALAVAPDVVLLDDPLSALDPSERDRMRGDLRLLQRKLGVAMVIATRNEIEALSLSDRVAVMDGGRVREIGTPVDLYRRPSAEDIRDRMGRSATFRGRVEQTTASETTVRLFDSEGPLVGATHLHGDDVEAGRDCLVTVRPESANVVPMEDAPNTGARNVVRGIIAALLFVGDHYEATIELPWNVDVRFDLPLSDDWREGQPVVIRLEPADLHVWLQPLPEREPVVVEAVAPSDEEPPPADDSPASEPSAAAESGAPLASA